MPVVFRNPGEIDRRAITTFGVSSKTEGAIGFFGTGLKYAIAICLREGCEVEIWTGGHQITFDTDRETIRFDEFDTIFMTDHEGRHRLGFTTELGKTWEMWQAYRELYCNCIDEGGQVERISDSDRIPVASDGETVVIVHGGAIERAHDNRFEEVLMRDSVVLHTDNAIAEVRAGASKFAYYRGIRAYDLGYPSLLTHNITMQMELSEDRNIKYEYRIKAAVGSAFGVCEDEDLIEKVLCAPNDTFEGNIDWTYARGLRGGTFEQVARRIAKTSPQRLNSTVMSALNIGIADSLPTDTQSSVMTGPNKQRLARALDFCHALGFSVDDYPIIVVEHIAENVMGLADKNRIFISSLAFTMGTKQVVSTLIEEYVHLKHGYKDCTREMQNWLFDTIITKGEEQLGEAL